MWDECVCVCEDEGEVKRKGWWSGGLKMKIGGKMEGGQSEKRGCQTKETSRFITE